MKRKTGLRAREDNYKTPGSPIFRELIIESFFVPMPAGTFCICNGSSLSKRLLGPYHGAVYAVVMNTTGG